jgi:hypothetical protein
MLYGIKQLHAKYAPELLKIAAASGGIAAILLLVGFRPYIPPEYIPNELIDVDFDVKVFRSWVECSIDDGRYLKSINELLTGKTMMLVTICNLISLIPGAGLILYGSLHARYEYAEVSVVSLRCGVWSAVALALAAAMLSWAGMPPAVDVRGLAVFWIFLNVILLKRTGIFVLTE